MNDKVNIITIEGYDEITRLFNQLKEEKEHWVREKQIAAQQGDRSENAEYIAAKENIRNIDKRLFKIQAIRSKAQIADTRKRQKPNVVLFGSVISVLKIEGETEEEMKIKIVGTNELQYVQKITKELCISNISPLGKQLIGKKEGEQVSVGKIEYEIEEIYS